MLMHEKTCVIPIKIYSVMQSEPLLLPVSPRFLGLNTELTEKREDLSFALLSPLILDSPMVDQSNERI